MSRIARTLSLVMFALALVALGANSAWAGAVQVTVTDQAGKPVANVAVLVTPKARVELPPLSTTPLEVSQRDLQFAPFLTVVRTGSTLRFVNRDPYDHHVRSLPGGPLGSIAPAKDFELRLDAADAKRERSAEVKVDKAGVIGLGCHLHSSMRGHVLVVDTPWFAKTDATGRATVEGLPDGSAELRLWHPDQLVDQPLQEVKVGAVPAQSAGQLNFTPKRRRGQ